MLDMGIIKTSKSPYASPVVIVKKKDGSNRVCADFGKLNRLTLLDSTPMTTAQDIFQKIDLTKGYWQIPMASKDIPKTLVTPYGAVTSF